MFDTSLLSGHFGSVEELRQAVEKTLRQRAFDLHEPLVFRRTGDGPVFDVRHADGHVVIQATDAGDRRVQLGIGLGSSGIVASELIPDPNFSIDPTLVGELFATQGNVARDAGDSGYLADRSGSGVPHSAVPFVPRAGWADALSNLHKSEDTEHAPGSAVKITRDGQKYWWVSEPWKWQAVRCTITAINADTLTCAVVANGNVAAETITVAKPCQLQQTPWDGVTVDGITYANSDSQTRTATLVASPYTVENQEVFPGYSAAGPCPFIYAIWTGNQTDESAIHWIDMNVDARHWIAV